MVGSWSGWSLLLSWRFFWVNDAFVARVILAVGWMSSYLSRFPLFCAVVLHSGTPGVFQRGS